MVNPQKKLSFLDATDEKLKKLESGICLGSIPEEFTASVDVRDISLNIPSTFTYSTPTDKGVRISTPLAAKKEKKDSRRLGS